MTDEGPDDRLDPEREDVVRRLLADARHDQPVPGDLSARLDRVLAELAADGPVDQPRVVDLATQRRRRLTRNLLVAAVAVVAIGVGLGQLDLGSISGSDADAGSTSAQDSAADSEVAAEAAPSEAAPRDDRAMKGLRAIEVAAKPVRVGDDDFDSLARLRAAAPTAPLAGSLDSGAMSAQRPTWFSCKRAPFGRGRLVAVRYQGTSAVLAVRPPTGDSVVVELLQCGTATVLRSATVPVP